MNGKLFVKKLLTLHLNDATLTFCYLKKFPNNMTKDQITLEDLFTTIKTKISQKEEGSYSYELAKKGVEKITRKVGEEALEVVIAAFVNEKNKSIKSREDLIGEVCDLFYHNLVLLASQEIEFSEILSELTRRNNHKK
jgi:phosphoribosyl-ATP pyrophosphohydrolase